MTSPHPLTDFVAGLPKAEIHVHHVGSASPRIVSELAARHPGTVPSDLDELREFYTFRDFAHFVEVYLAVVDLIKEPEDVRLLTFEVAREMGMSLPNTATAQQMFSACVANGGAEWDHSALVRALELMAKHEVAK